LEVLNGDRSLKAFGAWEDNINMDLKEIECEGLDWIQMARDKVKCRALGNTAMNPRIPQWGRGFCDQLSNYQVPKKDSACRVSWISENY
jgi:hypothetical protein